MNITTEQLKKVLNNHALWINNPEKGCRAYLTRANLYGANLRGANLSGADLSGANLWEVDLRGAKFTVELKDAVNLHTVVYDPHQFQFLALNLSFLKSVQSST